MYRYPQDSNHPYNTTLPPGIYYIGFSSCQGNTTGTYDINIPTFSINDVTVTETNNIQAIKFTVSLSSASGVMTKVDYYISNGTANSATDYIGQSGRLKFWQVRRARQ